MATPAILAKLTAMSTYIMELTPHQEYDANQLRTWEEVCRALGGLSRHERDYAEAKYQHDDESRAKSRATSRVFANMMSLWADVAIRENWKAGYMSNKQPPGAAAPLRLERLVLISLYQDVWSNRCGICKGVGSRVHQHIRIICDVCAGTGKMNYTRDSICKALGMSANTYWRAWQRRHHRIKHQLWRWDAAVYDACARIRL